mmetsp:Transcript_77428/g.223943  ORF Transcript_77428/g.223943 Transcript_77428/m.223943 type:complete len:280 (+) Transcript_77428:410-1249(+)
MAAAVSRVNRGPQHDRMLGLVARQSRQTGAWQEVEQRPAQHLDKQLEVLRVPVQLGPSLLRRRRSQLLFPGHLVAEELVVQVIWVDVGELCGEFLVFLDACAGQALRESRRQVRQNVFVQHAGREDAAQLEAAQSPRDRIFGLRIALGRAIATPAQGASAVGQRGEGAHGERRRLAGRAPRHDGAEDRLPHLRLGLGDLLGGFLEPSDQAWEQLWVHGASLGQEAQGMILLLGLFLAQGGQGDCNLAGLQPCASVVWRQFQRTEQLEHALVPLDERIRV